jgi:hypothetical protein
LATVVPWRGGLRKGATVAAVGSNSLLLVLLAEAMATGSTAAVVGRPDLNMVAAGDGYGIDLARLALVPDPGERWQAAVGALIDGLDLIIVATSGPVQDGIARVLMARARRRGCVLVPTRPWPGCDLVLSAGPSRWYGLGTGRGRLRLQETTVTTAGRGRAEQPRTTLLQLPPPSIVKRVGPAPGGIPGIPEDWIRNPDRTHGAPLAAVPVAVPVARPDVCRRLTERPASRDRSTRLVRRSGTPTDECGHLVRTA